ncbi:hypothetical protein CR513_43141, partial [Mucuna pruriens]
MVNESGTYDNLRLENQLTELTSLVRQLAVGQHQPSIADRVCGICTSVEHPTNICPTLKQPYQSRPFDNHFRKQPFRPRSSQGPYAARLSTTDSGISGTTVSTTTTTKNASSRQLTISGGPDEAISNKQLGAPTNHEL